MRKTGHAQVPSPPKKCHFPCVRFTRDWLGSRLRHELFRVERNVKQQLDQSGRYGAVACGREAVASAAAWVVEQTSASGAEVGFQTADLGFSSTFKAPRLAFMA